MTEFFKFLSGGIPGGAVLLIAVLVFANLTFSFFRKSGLVLREGYYAKFISLNAIVIVSYGLLWMANRPSQPADRLIILPTISSNNSFKLNGKSLILSDFFERNTYNFSGRFVVHKWEWLYKTLGREKSSLYENWEKLALNLNPYILIESKFNELGDWRLKVRFKDEERFLERTIREGSLKKDFKNFLADLELTLKRGADIEITNSKYLKTKLFIIAGKLDSALISIGKDSSFVAKTNLAMVFVNKGLQFKYDYEKLKYVDIINPDFEKAKKILSSLIKPEEDQPEVVFLLGRIAIRERNYESAEIYLKRAFVDEPRNSRIYYLLSQNKGRKVKKKRK